VVKSKQPECEFYIDQGLSIQEGTKVWVALRPEKIRISKQSVGNGTANSITGMVHDIGYLGGISTYRVQVSENQLIEITSQNHQRPKDGNQAIDWEEDVFLSWEPSSSVVLTR
jgi:putrescine transport system ATP-binding protein